MFYKNYLIFESVLFWKQSTDFLNYPIGGHQNFKVKKEDFLYVQFNIIFICKRLISIKLQHAWSGMKNKKSRFALFATTSISVTITNEYCPNGFSTN